MSGYSPSLSSSSSSLSQSHYYWHINKVYGSIKNITKCGIPRFLIEKERNEANSFSQLYFLTRLSLEKFYIKLTNNSDSSGHILINMNITNAFAEIKSNCSMLHYILHNFIRKIKQHLSDLNLTIENKYHLDYCEFHIHNFSNAVSQFFREYQMLIECMTIYIKNNSNQN